MTLPILAEAAAKLGRPLSETQLALFVRFRDVLLEWNAKINVTGIREPAAVETLHFVDALAGLAALPATPGLAVVDIGSGGGLPGLALRIARPDLRVTLVDSIMKKAKVIQEIATALGLMKSPADGGPPVDVLAERAEDLGHLKGQREAYDVACARAVGEAALVAELVIPLIKVGGRAVMWKKRDIPDELGPGRRAAQTLGAKLLLEQPVDLPGLPADRQLLIFLKEKSTDARFPRAAGMPKKNPLGGA